MPFQPFNDNHAIQNAAFAFSLNRKLQPPTIVKLRNEPAPWRKDLPALEIPQEIEMVSGPAGTPRAALTQGAEFSFKRPDGSAETALTILGAEVAVLTTNYTRWDETWAKAKSYLSEVMRRIAQLETDIELKGATLSIIDVFENDDEDPDVSTLLVKDPHIAHSIFDSGRLWHSHTGWFAARPSGRILNQFNIDARDKNKLDMASGVSKPTLEVVFTHLQQLQLSPQPKITAVAIEDIIDHINEEVSHMHLQNKELIRAVLVSSMQDRIGITR